jgi:hypothetical protein
MGTLRLPTYPPLALVSPGRTDRRHQPARRLRASSGSRSSPFPSLLACSVVELGKGAEGEALLDRAGRRRALRVRARKRTSDKRQQSEVSKTFRREQ